MEKILLGNVFPTSLVKRQVLIEPIALDEAKRLLAGGYDSFWGHTNTLLAAKEQLGVDVAPKTERPALKLDQEGLPYLVEGEVAMKIILLSPSYKEGFRPAIGEEVSTDDIVGWTALLVTFP